jgi:hypothetical protein
LTTPYAILGLGFLMVAARFLLLQTTGTLRPAMFGLFEMAEPELTDYLRQGLWIVPIVALVSLALTECARAKRDHASSASTPTR